MTISKDELKKLAEAATPRPWAIDNYGWYIYSTDTRPRYEIVEIPGEGNWEAIPDRDTVQRNADYVLAACNALPELIDEIAVLEDREQRLYPGWQKDEEKVRRELFTITNQLALARKALKDSWRIYTEAKADDNGMLEQIATVISKAYAQLGKEKSND